MKKFCVNSILISALTFSFSALATEVLNVEIRTEGGMYYMHGESLIKAPVDFIFDIMFDYDNFHLIAGGIADTHFLEPEEDGTLRGYTRIDSCILFYCREFVKVERIWASAPTKIVAEVVADESDFDFNRTTWTFKSTDAGTLVMYDAQMDPSFWVPPVIGPWAFKKKLWSSAEKLGYRIEYLYSTGKSLSSFSNQEQ